MVEKIDLLLYPSKRDVKDLMTGIALMDIKQDEI
jgi:hypothetical protein